MESRTQERVLSLDAIFPTVEDVIQRQKTQDPDLQSLRKRKLADKLAGNRKAIHTHEWREAVIRLAQNIPMAVLIEEFMRYYYTSPKRKRGSRVTPDQDSRPLFANDCPVIQQLPNDILENIFSRISLADLLTSRSVFDDWAAVYASRHFQSVYDRTDRCIFINNNNLDIWAFSITSTRWFELKVPCNWDKWGMKTLGLKAACDGLFLVARSDFTLFVVNPLTAKFKSLPRICPHTRGCDKFVKCLIVHGTAELQVNRDSGDYTVYLFGNWQGRRESFVHLARYTSTTKLWTVQPISMLGNGIPLFSTIFPSPLWSFRRDNVITCVSTTCEYFHYSFDNNTTNNNKSYAMVNGNLFLNGPTMMDFEYCHGKICYSNVSLPTFVPCGGGRLILVGRLKRNGPVKPMYGKLPIVPHSELGIWQFVEYDNQIHGHWKMIDSVQVDSIKHMIESSEGTDFLVVGNDGDSIWFVLRGSDIMLEFRISNKLWLMYDVGCPGGGSLDANFHWKALFGCLRFGATV